MQAATEVEKGNEEEENEAYQRILVRKDAFDRRCSRSHPFFCASPFAHCVGIQERSE